MADTARSIDLMWDDWNAKRAPLNKVTAFDVELMIQDGVRLFRTDSALLSPDWVSNKALDVRVQRKRVKLRLDQPGIPEVPHRLSPVAEGVPECGPK